MSLNIGNETAKWGDGTLPSVPLPAEGDGWGASGLSVCDKEWSDAKISFYLPQKMNVVSFLFFSKQYS